MNFNKRNLVFVVIIIALTTIVKLICAPQINLSGFSPVIAVSLFSGYTFSNKKKAFLLPLVCLFSSDLILQALYLAKLFPFAGLYKWQLLNYSLFILVTLIGIALRRLKTAGLIVSAFVAPLIFFLVSNFFVWAVNGEGMGYSKNMAGLMQCYTFGLPFFRNSLLATVIFLPLVIYLYNGIVRQHFTFQPVTVTNK